MPPRLHKEYKNIKLVVVSRGARHSYCYPSESCSEVSSPGVCVLSTKTISAESETEDKASALFIPVLVKKSRPQV